MYFSVIKLKMFDMNHESNVSAAVLRLDRQRKIAKQRSKMAEEATDLVRRVEFGQRRARRNLLVQFDRASLDGQKDQLQKKREELKEAEKKREEAKEQMKIVEMMLDMEKRRVAMVLGGYEEMATGHSFPAGTMDNLEYSNQVVKEREELRKDQKKAASKLERMRKEVEATKKSLWEVQQKVQEKEVAAAEITRLQNLAYEKTERVRTLSDQQRMRDYMSIEKERNTREWMRTKDQYRERLKAQLQAVQEGKLL